MWVWVGGTVVHLKRIGPRTPQHPGYDAGLGRARVFGVYRRASGIRLTWKPHPWGVQVETAQVRSRAPGTDAAFVALNRPSRCPSSLQTRGTYAMTRKTTPKYSRSLLCSLAAIVSVACGEAPMVTHGDEADSIDDGVTHTAMSSEQMNSPVTDELGSPDTTAAPNGSDVPTNESPPRDQQLIMEAQPEPEPEADVCGPSIFPQTNNVPVEVERTITETIEVEVEVEVPPTVLMLLDRSLSMTEQIGDSDASRWQTLQRILFEGDEPLLQGISKTANLGMTHFTAARGTQGPDGSGHCVDLTVPVDEIAFTSDNFEQLASQQDGVKLGYGTPTGEALAAVSESFRGLETEGEKHIIVVTDGEPAHCNALLDFSSEQATGYVLQAAHDAAAMGITVHVIGIGPDINGAHLAEMAEAGGGQYRSALTGDSLATAFSDVLREVDVVTIEEVQTRTEVETMMEEQRSCEFELEFGELGPDAFLQAGHVAIDGEGLLLDDEDGWTIDDRDMLVLQGRACDTYMTSEDMPQVAVELACPNRFLGTPR